MGRRGAKPKKNVFPEKIRGSLEDRPVNFT
jgi:hypothetical protein